MCFIEFGEANTLLAMRLTLLARASATALRALAFYLP
jgi:hypothetical protein